MERHLNNDYSDGSIKAKDLAIFRSGKLRGTGMLITSLRKGKEYENFASLFFSKPFGEAQRGRFNNLTLFEEYGGYWNRMDVEYSFTDNLLGSLEWNNYWGDPNTAFGQMRNSSSVQAGVKYLFE